MFCLSDIELFLQFKLFYFSFNSFQLHLFDFRNTVKISPHFKFLPSKIYFSTGGWRQCFMRGAVVGTLVQSNMPEMNISA